MTRETRGFSRVAAGFSSYDGEFRLPLVLAQEVQSCIQLVRESWGLLSSHFRAKSPHLSLGPRPVGRLWEVPPGAASRGGRAPQPFPPASWDSRAGQHTDLVRATGRRGATAQSAAATAKCPCREHEPPEHRCRSSTTLRLCCARAPHASRRRPCPARACAVHESPPS